MSGREGHRERKMTTGVCVGKADLSSSASIGKLLNFKKKGPRSENKQHRRGGRAPGGRHT